MVTYEVVPSEGLWVLRLDGDSQSEVHASKGSAVARARQLALQHAGKMRVLGEDGAVEVELEPRRGEGGGPSREH